MACPLLVLITCSYVDNTGYDLFTLGYTAGAWLRQDKFTLLGHLFSQSVVSQCCLDCNIYFAVLLFHWRVSIFGYHFILPCIPLLRLLNNINMNCRNFTFLFLKFLHFLYIFIYKYMYLLLFVILDQSQLVKVQS